MEINPIQDYRNHHYKIERALADIKYDKTGIPIQAKRKYLKDSIEDMQKFLEDLKTLEV